MSNSIMPQDGEPNETANKVFVNLTHKDPTTGIPSLNQGPGSELHGPKKSKVDNQVLIAAMVLLVGVVSVYGMRYMGMAAGLDENAVTIDYTAEGSASESTKRFNQVLGALNESSHVMQFNDSIKMPEHPFARDTVAEASVADPGMSDAERLEWERQQDFDNARQARVNAIESELYNFELQGVIGGKRPAARISGRAVRAGMELGDFFTVIEITGRAVLIEADGVQYELSMGQEPKLVD